MRNTLTKEKKWVGITPKIDPCLPYVYTCTYTYRHRERQVDTDRQRHTERDGKVGKVGLLSHS